MQQFGKGALRVAKNYTKGYSDTQAKVRDATSNDPWGPSGTQMNEIAQMTFNQGDFVEIMEMLDKRLNDKGKNWRHVHKSLAVLDYLLHAGSENVVIYFRDNIYIIKTLKEFQYVDESERTRVLTSGKRLKILPICCKTKVVYAKNADLEHICATAWFAGVPLMTWTRNPTRIIKGGLGLFPPTVNTPIRMKTSCVVRLRRVSGVWRKSRQRREG